jgi:structure-specific endonuclease subunit SLX1
MIKCKYFVYLLKSEVSNRTYIGFTVNISRRLKQHNGLRSGGAKRTRKGRPWKVVLFVSGFEFERTALQYEFCIQHTKKYKRTSGIANKIKIMKALLKQEKICSTAPLNSEMNLVIFYSDYKYFEMWKNS